MRGTRKNRKGKIEKNQKVKEGPCIFPFKHKRKDYDVCMKTDKGEICATEINEKTRTMTKYGYCEPEERCPSRKKKSSSPRKTLKKPKKLKRKVKLIANTPNKKAIKKLISTSPKKGETTNKAKMSHTKLNKKTRKVKLNIVKSLKPSPQKSQEMAAAVKEKHVYNDEFVDILGQLEDIMTRQGEPFRARAYHKAAESIMTYSDDITDPKQVEGLPGIGKTIITKLNEYVTTGKLNAIEKRKNDPINILTKVYGIGPKKAKDFVKEGLDSIEKLKQHPEKLTKAQKFGVEHYNDIEERIPRAEIDEYKIALEKVFKESTPPGSKFEIVGSYRRGKEESGDIDLIITNSENNRKAFEDFLNALVEKEIIIALLSKGRTKSLTIARLPEKKARRIDLMYAPPAEYAFATLYFTGSKAFNTMQRQRALDLEYTLNEHGFHEMKNGRKGAKVEKEFPTEESIFEFLGMVYKPPTDRRDGRSVVLKSKPEQSLAKNVIVPPDPQDLGKAEAVLGQPEPIVTAAPQEKPRPKKKRRTLKKQPASDPKDLIKDFKKKGVSFLKTLTATEIAGMIDQANQAYYGNKDELMSDEQYDLLREYAQREHGDDEEVKQIADEGHVGLQIEGLKNKVKLPYEMWSMDKIKPDTGYLSKWAAKFSGPYVLSCKLDGVSGLYAGGKLYTRGNGIVGQDVSHLIPYLQLPSDSNAVIRGEFIISKQLFAKKYANDFSNPRNFVAGVVNSKTVDVSKVQDLNFVAYEVVEPEMKPSEQMALLTNANVECVRFIEEKTVSNEILSELLVSWREDYKYEIDGVICVDDKVYPRKRGNPEHAFAFKMVLGDQVAEAKVVAVIWTASKDGYLKPRVQVEPVVLSGVKIEYATGFNAKFIVDNNIGVGAIISLVRSGDVIPHIMSVVKPAPEPMMPEVEYNWNSTHVDIVVANKTANKIVNQKVMTAFFKTIEIDGMGSGTVKKLIAAGYDSIPKVIAMTKKQFLEIDGFKQKMADKIHDGIEEKMAAASLPVLMDATNIWGRGFGKKRFTTILAEYPDILTSNESDAEKVEKVKSVSGMAKKSAEKFIENIPEFKSWAKEAGVADKLKYKSHAPEIDKSHPLYGKKIVITGFRDKELAANIEAVGGQMGSSVSKSTFAVLVKDKDEDTGKADQAKKLGVTLMTPEEFKDKYF
ncbi:MAG: hypothetical protein CMI79_03455 [Candidatus Pelagibacter sp.]|nr:hypothetical protein [Candidatus Pelagibacter sp.]